jgi:hypothetical protein
MAWTAMALVEPLSAQGLPAAPGPPNELDAFMQKVLARREVNRQTLKEYVLDEAEGFEILGPGRAPLYRTRREFTWYVRDGVHVRSPLRFNGVGIDEDKRRQYEHDWLAREKRRAERREKRNKEGDRGGGEVAITPDGVEISPAGVPTQPRFVSEAYFMDFKFEPGNYYLAGREKLDGQEVLKIEYYPTGLFKDDDPPEARKQDKSQEFEDRMMRRMNKTSLITLWVDPSLHQIVKYTFDNVWLDFLPAAWLVRVDDMRASMTMGQPFPGVWLPRDINIHAGVTLANGSFEAGYSRTFSDYRQADVATKVRIPKERAREDRPSPEAQPFDDGQAGSGPFVDSDPVVQDPAQPAEVVAEVRIHGNAFLKDEEVLKLAGIVVGQPLESVDAIRNRLKSSGHFESVEVRKRYRSLTDTSQVALVLLVHERPGNQSETLDVPTNPVTRQWRRFTSRLMFLPILSYADGYGFTYGARVSTVDLLGIGERLSIPLTWGGTRRAALEFERTFKTGPLTRVEASAAIWSRENPRYEIRDQRDELKARAEKVFGGVLRAGVEASRSWISFADLDDDLRTVTTNIVLDTRGDPAYPGNAVLLGAGWTAMNFGSRPDRVNRYTADARGYLRIVGRAVVAGHAQYIGADARLPPYERLLLGGSSTIRGFDTGAFEGDRTLATSAELRVPFTSVLNGAKLGFTVFADAAKGWDFGTRMQDAEWHRGAGAGLFLIASIVRINLDVARGLRNGDTHVHLSSGFTF